VFVHRHGDVDGVTHELQKHHHEYGKTLVELAPTKLAKMRSSHQRSSVNKSQIWLLLVLMCFVRGSFLAVATSVEYIKKCIKNCQQGSVCGGCSYRKLHIITSGRREGGYSLQYLVQLIPQHRRRLFTIVLGFDG
jgi:hypothetical protein